MPILSVLFHIVLCAGMVLLVPTVSSAATHVVAAPYGAAQVQAAIDAARSGDTVAIPACNVTWTSRVSISGKALTLQGSGATTSSRGAGTFGTHITAGSLSTLEVSASAANFVTVKGMEFIGSVSGTGSVISIDGTTNGTVGFRITNVKFTSVKTSKAISVYDLTYGLIDHVTIQKSGVIVKGVEIVGSEEDAGYAAWKVPLERGTNKAVYIEDSVFDYDDYPDGAYDGYNGSRVVFRYNSLYNTAPGAHGTDSGGHRSLMDQVIHNNDYYNTTEENIEAGRTRGGGVLYYNNTLQSGSWGGFNLINYRSCEGYAGQGSWELCDGTNWKVQSPDYIGMSTSGDTMFCSVSRDTLCTSNANCPAGETCTSFFDGPTNGYPCRDQPGRVTQQMLSPIYSWGNSAALDPGVFPSKPPCPRLDGTGATGDIQKNRDFYNASSLSDARSKGLTYTEYVYPHPLTGAATPPPVKIPNPPGNVHVE